jgi:GMP synthase-like glutamine amidotransferase
LEVVVIANRGDDDAGLVGAALRDHGARLSITYREDQWSWPALEAIDMVLSLGSDWSVYWDHIGSEVEREAAFLRRAHEAGVPIFGICYGAQIASYALGGQVSRAPVTEIGWYDLATEVGRAGNGPWFEWHVDTFTVPPGGEELARSDAGVQAMLVGRTFATQFHPEVDVAIVSRWSEGGKSALDEAGQSVQDLMWRTQTEMGAAPDRARKLVDWFLDEVAR